MWLLRLPVSPQHMTPVMLLSDGYIANGASREIPGLPRIFLKLSGIREAEPMKIPAGTSGMQNWR